MTGQRTLYQCSHARVSWTGRAIRCDMGYSLDKRHPAGLINIERLIRGDRLNITRCQSCHYYDEMGPPVPDGERGWISNLLIQTG